MKEYEIDFDKVDKLTKFLWEDFEMDFKFLLDNLVIRQDIYNLGELFLCKSVCERRGIVEAYYCYNRGSYCIKFISLSRERKTYITKKIFDYIAKEVEESKYPNERPYIPSI